MFTITIGNVVYVYSGRRLVRVEGLVTYAKEKR